MADETKRVIDQTTDQSLSAGDFIIVDSQSEGTRKFDLGTELTDIKQDLAELEGGGLSDDAKMALLQLAQKVAYIDDDGQTYYQDLYDALYPSAPPATLTSITCVYTQSGTVYDTDTLDSLKSDLVVTAHYDDSTTQTVTNYTLSGTLTEGTSTITVSYGGKTATFDVIVSYPIIGFYNGANPSYLSNLHKYGLENTYGYSSARASAYLTEGYNSAVRYYIYDNGARYPDPSYPLYIPNGATKITVDCPDLCCAINVHKDEDGIATTIDNGHWSNVGGETDYDLSSFIASGATHLSIGFKNSAGTSLENITIDSTTVSISFS